MRSPPEVLESVRNWVAKAEGDFNAAAHLLDTGDEEFNDAVCFHAQQCAEKYLKVLLQLNGIDFPYTHDLGCSSSFCLKRPGRRSGFPISSG